MNSRYFISVVLLTLAACTTPTPPAPPSLGAPTQAAVAPTPTSAAIPLSTPTTPTVASTATPAYTPTPAGTPTRTNTPVPTPTRTIPALPTPAGVTFKFDDGVPQDQRDTIIAGMAMARAYLGESRPITVIAYADLNAQMDEIARIRGVPRTSLAQTQQLLQTDRAFGGASLLAFPMSKTWQARSQEERMRTMVHEYFHAVEAFLTNTDPYNYSVAEWLFEGTADYAAYHVLAKYGYYNLDEVYKERQERTRGVVSALGTMEIQRLAEREMINTPYYFGYLADEMLSKMAGEEAVLKKFWENYPKYPGWQLAFQATFGISVDDFYKRFEDERRAKFPPYCGTQGEYKAPAPSDPFTLKFIRQDPPGALTFPLSPFTFTPPAPVAYTFCASGYNITTLPSAPSPYQFPTGYAGAISCGGNCVIVYMRQSTAPGSYTFAIELPDKRRAEIKFDHSIPPTPTPRP